jgi:hypothetical protein
VLDVVREFPDPFLEHSFEVASAVFPGRCTFSGRHVPLLPLATANRGPSL